MKNYHARKNLRISSWSYDMEGHAKKCVERYCSEQGREKDPNWEEGRCGRLGGQLPELCGQKLPVFVDFGTEAATTATLVAAL